MNNQPNPTRVITGKVRLSYMHVFSPFAAPGSMEAKYSVTILLPKSDLATKQRIDAAISAAIEQGVSNRWNGVRPPIMSIPIHDGDGVRPSDGQPFSEECKGHWVFTASSKQPPQVVDVNLNPVINQTEVYSGIYGRVSVNFFPYLNSGKRGIGCGLNNIQKLEDGEPLGNRTNAADDFGQPTQYGQAQYQPQQYPQTAQPYAQPNMSYPAQPYPQPQPNTAYNTPQYIPPTQPQSYPQLPQQIDPITGKPIVGQVMGL